MRRISVIALLMIIGLPVHLRAGTVYDAVVGAQGHLHNVDDFEALLMGEMDLLRWHASEIMDDITRLTFIPPP